MGRRTQANSELDGVKVDDFGMIPPYAGGKSVREVLVAPPGNDGKRVLTAVRGVGGAIVGALGAGSGKHSC